MVRDQLAPGQEVEVWGFGQDAEGNYEDFAVAEPYAPSLGPHATIHVIGGANNTNKQPQSCFAVPRGKSGTTSTRLVPEHGFVAGPPAPRTIKEMAAQGSCDRGKIERDIKEGRAVDDRGVVDRQVKEGKGDFSGDGDSMYA